MRPATSSELRRWRGFWRAFREFTSSATLYMESGFRIASARHEKPWTPLRLPSCSRLNIGPASPRRRRDRKPALQFPGQLVENQLVRAADQFLRLLPAQRVDLRQ